MAHQAQKPADSFGTRTGFEAGGRRYQLYSVAKLAERYSAVARLPRSLKVLAENLLRLDNAPALAPFLSWNGRPGAAEIAFVPARVLMQDFTGVPCIVDLAVMREAVATLGGDPAAVNPRADVDLVIDHSVQVDQFGTAGAFEGNLELEYARNRERYVFLKWGQRALRGFRVVPPGTGICHQVNLEYLSSVVRLDGDLALPDTLVGTDSHTTMVNGLGVLGWGVGGIEAEAALIGQPLSLLVPEVVGVALTGKLREGVNATDAVLTLTELLRRQGVVGKFVEFFGPGLAELPVPARATLANMAPEYGATCGFFPVDEGTLAYLRLTGRAADDVARVEAYCRAQGLFADRQSEDPVFTDVVPFDLGAVEACIAGPFLPQDRVPLRVAKRAVRKTLAAWAVPGVPDEARTVRWAGAEFPLRHGAVVLAAITSCTNTSNPEVMLGAGLLAKKAVERGLAVPPWVKTSLAPGSRVVWDYLSAAGLVPYLEALGFHRVAFGCTTCIGNSGPLPAPVAAAVSEGKLAVAAVLSGNRNFEGRINPDVRLSYLASPPLVVAYALAGRVDFDPVLEPLGTGHNGEPVFLKDVWPSAAEVQEAVRASARTDLFVQRYARLVEGDDRWRALPAPGGQTFEWDPGSTYVRRPPFLDGLTREPAPLADVRGARALVVLGDSVTTDHISPAGDIAPDSPAAHYLLEHGVAQKDFNSYGARRGNFEVMVRGTFANVRLKNHLVPGQEGCVTPHLPSGDRMSIFDAAQRYRAEGVPLVVLAGSEYGTGSSRDWAAKGTLLLGVRAVLAKSYERIHRTNLVGMGVLPLQFEEGQDCATLGLSGRETFDVAGIATGLTPRGTVSVTARGEGVSRAFKALVRVDTPVELDYFRHGGVLPFVVRQLAVG